MWTDSGLDAVSSMLYLDYGRENGEYIPNQYGGNTNLEAIGFLKKVNAEISAEREGVITIAEEATAYPMVTAPPKDGGLGFSFKWNMGYMNDTLEYFRLEPCFRAKSPDSVDLCYDVCLCGTFYFAIFPR